MPSETKSPMVNANVFGLPVQNEIKLLDIDMSMHRENRERLLEQFQKASDVPKNSNCLIYLEGGNEAARYNTDCEEFFRQESYFFWCFGVNEPDMKGFINIDTGVSTLIVMDLPAEYEIWMGRRRSKNDYKELYDVDDVIFPSELDLTMANLDPQVVYTLQGINTDSGVALMSPKLPPSVRVDVGKMFPIISYLRTIKTQKEIDLMRNINEICSEAHLAVMAATRPGMRESEMEALFHHWAYAFGLCRYFAYIPICASGPNGAILHYGHAGAPNSRIMEDGDMVVNDMGGERHCFASDITCSFPVNGKFTADQRFVYETVLKANNTVEDEMKPGVYWPDMQTLAYKVILMEFIDAGILEGNVDDMMKDNVASIFMPHGLGHLIGIDTHDVGGKPKGCTADRRFGYKAVRLYKKLEEGMVVTCEPGCYFIDVLFERNKDVLSKYANMEKLNRFRGIGGVRIEDNVVVTETGIEVLTKVPRTVEQIEEACAGKLTGISQVKN